jgi:membrane-bound metal-dependent hydrolase YbcI (DUF457 family)
MIMDFFTHLVFGALMYLLFLKEVTFNYLFYAMFFAILPDLDVFISPLRRVFKTNYLEHRSGSHSYVIGIILSAIIGGIYSISTQQSFFIIWIIGMVFYGIHVSLDLLTTTKIPCFYPISKREHCFYVEKAGSSFTLLTSWIFITSLLIVFHFFPNIILMFLVINIYTYFTIAYYGFRIFTRVWIGSHLKDDQKYFPGVLPLYFFIFEKKFAINNLSLSIEKKSHIAKPKLIYNNSFNLTPQEMDFFKKSAEKRMEHYYFSKWTVLPVFLRNNEIFSVRFFFLEPMIRTRASYIQFDFDTINERLIGYERRFGHIKIIS